MKSILSRLNINSINAGAFAGDNGWIDSSQKVLIDSFNPFNRDKIASVQPADMHSYKMVLNAAIKSFETWRKVPVPVRGNLLRDLSYVLRQNKKMLGDLVSLETGKIRSEGHGEVQEMIDIADFAAGLSRTLYGKTMHSERPGHRMFEQWHPLGVVAVISTFNFPVAVWAWNAMIAAVCGNSVIWKPSSKTPLSAIAVQNICNPVLRDYKVSGLFGLVVGSGDTIGKQILEEKEIPLVSFTGSCKTGRTVSSVVAGRFGRTILELGGNNAVIVTPSANMDMALRGVVFGALGTAGQRCTTTRRLIVQRGVKDKLVKKLVQIYSQIKLGDPLLDDTLMGPLIDEAAVENMLQAIAVAKEQGGKLLTGGMRQKDRGPLFVTPAIIDMPSQTSIVKKETFAPVLYVLTYDSFDEAIKLNNNVSQGLSSAVFTTDISESEKFLSQTGSDCGIANVNIGTSGAEIGGAFGGEKDTGGGREAGSDAWKAYMRRQTSTLNWSQSLPLAQGIKFDIQKIGSPTT
jgi:aldehyde dehydrogenase (NAD+)